MKQDIIKVVEYGQTPETETNLPIIQLIINFFTDEIHLTGNPMDVKTWYGVRGKKELLELTWNTHNFGFISFGEGKIEDLVENGEFLRHILGKILSVTPIYFNTKYTYFELEQILRFEIFDLQADDITGSTLSYQCYINDKLRTAELLHAYDLVGLKSLLFKFLLIMREKDLTFTVMKDQWYQQRLRAAFDKKQENNDAAETL